MPTESVEMSAGAPRTWRRFKFPQSLIKYVFLLLILVFVTISLEYVNVNITRSLHLHIKLLMCPIMGT